MVTDRRGAIGARGGGPRRKDRLAGAVALAVVSGLACSTALAEPYIALRTGLKCSSCHMNRTGGGERTEYGAGYGRTGLPPKGSPFATSAFDGAITPRVRLGADLRANFEWSRPSDSPSETSFGIAGAQLYGGVSILQDRLSLYVDERVAPEGALNREAFALLSSSRGGLYVKAGRFLQPYGLRLQDDEAFTRDKTGFSFASSDTGIELGAEPGPWSFALSATNGAGGSEEKDNGKEFNFTGAFVHKRFRVGVSASINDLADHASKNLAGAFGGVKAGPVVLLAEWDGIRDEPSDAPEVKSEASHLEADWSVVQGLTLRVWGGLNDPNKDLSGDNLKQAGLGADWTFLPGAQLRAYYRYRDGPESVPGSRRDETSLEMHLYF